MKETVKKVLLKAIIAAGMLLAVVGAAILGRNKISEYRAEERQHEATPLVITTPDPATDGTLTVYDEDGGIYYQYFGEIEIRNDGKDGEHIDIVVQLPETGCSCFDEDGNILK